jgi:hypothetical protein
MKLRTILSVIILCFAVAHVNAQKAGKFELGLQGGVSSTWIINQNNYGLPELDYDSYVGNGFNLQLGYNINNEMGVFTEVGFTKQGQKYKGDMNQYDVVYRKIDMNYLNIPLFFKYTYGETRARFRLLVGPQFSFLQKAEQEYTLDGKNASDELAKINDLDGVEFDPGAKDITDRYNSMDIMAVLDLGADIFLIGEMLYLSVGGRFYYGFNDINAGNYQLKNIDDNYDPSHNGGGGLYLGIHYVIGGKVE